MEMTKTIGGSNSSTTTTTMGTVISGISRFARFTGRRGQITLLYLIAMAALVISFQPQPHRGNPNPNPNANRPNNHNINGQVKKIVRSKTYEPRTTEFPKTTTPEDDENDRRERMFSPMDRNDPRNPNHKRRQEQQQQRRQQQAQEEEKHRPKSIWETSAPILVEASSLHTADFEEPSVERVQVLLKKSDMDPMTGARRATRCREPLIARVDLWHGPDSTPQNLAIYLEDDDDDDEDDDEYDDYDHLHDAHFHDRSPTMRNRNSGSNTCDTPFSTIIETPHGHNTIAIRNVAESTDLLTYVEGEENENWYKPSAPPSSSDSPLQSVIQRLKATTTPQRIDSTTARKSPENGDETSNKAVVGSCTVGLPSEVASVQVLLQTDFMQPIQARIELELRTKDYASGGNNNNYRVVKRTIVEVYSEDGMHRPFFAVLETPRKTNRWKRQPNRKGGEYSTSMKVVNLSTTEFPLFATVEPHAVDELLEDEEEDYDDEEDDGDDSAAAAATDQGWTHFGGGSNYDLNSNSTILDAEIL